MFFERNTHLSLLSKKYVENKDCKNDRCNLDIYIERLLMLLIGHLRNYLGIMKGLGI